ncbi:MAG: YkgJ family cysteine cluster protein [Desulfurivibrionaceae bacterium]|nr:YkgJ family cysteine cluster protein [Desulfurivibrionaceae bacterium]
MTDRRQELLLALYSTFEQWLEAYSLPFVCQPGCATCCTRKVTMTAVEADLIRRFISTSGHSRPAETAEGATAPPLVTETTNELAARCLHGTEGREPEVEEEGEAGVCPYLAEARCQIYEVRPFACRSFASLQKCRSGEAAQLPQFYLTAATAAQQLIEHVGQGGYWGNMHDLLLFLEEAGEPPLPAAIKEQARARLRRARPLPGFLIGTEEYERVRPFIDLFFNKKIGGNRVEDILNGK